jgi:tetratricopeptide (TPR) repeat protein
VSAVCTSGIKAQILHDSLAVRMIEQGISYMYNMKFNKADTILSEIEQLYPGHPVIYLLKSIMISWENYPLIPSSSGRHLFEEDLRTCIDLSNRKPYSEDFEAESLLTNICARGLLLTFYAENDLSLNVFPLAAGTYKYLMRSFNYVSTFGDFYFFRGLYNYYREAYPIIHPVYKPIASLFPHGDMVKGLNDIDRSAESAVFLKAEAYSMLTWIYAGFENDYPRALTYSRILYSLYPANPLFTVYHIKNLLLLHKYDEAEIIINDAGKETSNVFFCAQIKIFNGILQEKKYRNYVLAKQFYVEGISALMPFGDYGNEYCAYAYLGLSRLSDYSGDDSGRRVYRKKGLDLIDFREVSFE